MDLWRDEALNGRAAYRYQEGLATHTGVKVLAESLVESGALSHTIRYGFDHYTEKTELSQDSVLVSGEKVKSSAIFMEDEISLDNGLTFTPGVRYSRYDMDASFSDETYTETTWGLTSEYTITDGLVVRASSTQLFQGPLLAEVFIGAGNGLIIDPNFKPTTGVNNELGFSFSPNDFFDLDQFTIAATYYESDVDDWIESEDSRTGPVNQGDFELDGFEVLLKVTEDNLGASLSYAQSNSENKDTGDQLGRDVGDSITLSLDADIESINTRVSWTSMMTLDKDVVEDGVDHEKGGYNVHNLAARWKSSGVEGLSVSAGIDNIFDEYYVSHASRIGDTFHPVFGELHLNDYEPGRNYKVSVSYVF